MLLPDHTDFSVWGASTATYLHNIGFDSESVLTNALLVNIPQLLLSIVYITINAMFTRVALAREWASMATAHKGLRVTLPCGQQRSTYFLQLPYIWAVPLMLTSAILHWLVSQTVFLAELYVQDRNGTIDYDKSISACGISGLALIVLSCIAGMMLFVVVGTLALRPKESIPMASSCSATMSAACHPPPDDDDCHLKPVRWGVLDAEYEIRHCTFTSQAVTKPIPGEMYA